MYRIDGRHRHMVVVGDRLPRHGRPAQRAADLPIQQLDEVYCSIDGNRWQRARPDEG